MNQCIEQHSAKEPLGIYFSAVENMVYLKKRIKKGKLMLTKEAAQHVIYEIMKLYPNAVPTMHYQNPFQLLMVVILSAQATDVSVAKVKDKLFERYPNPQAVSESSPEEIESYIKTVGLYRNKAKYIYKSSCQLLEKFDGKVPNTRKELQSLTGIGPKSANILSKSLRSDDGIRRLNAGNNVSD